MFKKLLCLVIPIAFLAPAVYGKACPAITGVNSMGIGAGAFPHQYDVSEFENLGKCTISYRQNPNIASLNQQLNPGTKLPTVEKRLPIDPLVYSPYNEIGKYGGRLNGLSKSPESGTSDFLSLRHSQLFRFDEDLKTVVPNVAKSWKYNRDSTELTVTLRKGHKWSDGQPFTAEDVAFWYNGIKLNKEMYKNVESIWLYGGKPMEVTAVNETTVLFKFATPAPNFVRWVASQYRQLFQPKHVLSKYMPKYNKKANANAKKLGFEDWKSQFKLYYHDWKDTYHPLSGPKGSRIVIPTLESHVLVKETPEFRRFVANPYFFIVDTAGNQLPYIDVHKETYSENIEVTLLKMINGEIDYKQQSIQLDNYPTLKSGEATHPYRVLLKPAPGQEVFIAFNITHRDPAKAKVFGDVRFRRAMSLAINSAEVNEIVYLGQGTVMGTGPANASTTDFVDTALVDKYSAYDPQRANAMLDEMGLTKRDSEGFRLRFDGKRLIVFLHYAPQGGPAQLYELVKTYWDSVGVRTDLKELTSDVYRANNGVNKHDIATWNHGNNLGISLTGGSEVMIPPFGSPINKVTGIPWAEWKDTKGASGIEPPADIKSLFRLAEEFKSYSLGSADSNRVGAEIVKVHANNMIWLGTVNNIPEPIFANNRVGNFADPSAKTYAYYWIFPMRPTQWFIK